MSGKVLAMIPARGGSARISGKNIRFLHGKPLIAYTIEAARAADTIDRVLVTTDCENIARIAVECGAEAPFLRPAEIAQGHSTEMEFLLHALEWLKANEKYEPALIVLLYPTSPFRKAATIDRAVETILARPDADSLRSVRLCSEHPYKMWRIKDDRLVPFVQGVDRNMHTWSYQRLPEVYIQNASIYITRPKTIYDKGNPMGDIILPFIMSETESIDINTSRDWQIAENILVKKAK